MSKELDEKIDGLRDKLVEDARTPIGMANGRQKLRTAQEIALGILNVTDAINEAQQVSQAKLDALEKALEAEIAKGET